MDDKEKFSVFNYVDGLKPGDEIEIEVFEECLHKGTISRVYRIGEALYFDVDVIFNRERLFRGSTTYIDRRKFDYSQMARSIVTDKVDDKGER